MNRREPGLRSGRRPRRGGLHAVLLRRLPGETVMHRLDVGTKLIGLTGLTIATGLNTGWAQLVGVAVIAALTVIAARVPLRATPRLPPALGALVLVSFALTAAGGGAERFLRLVGFSVLFAVLSLVIAWTTDLGELAPALARLGRPLRRLGMPIDDWAVTAALAIRCLPLIIDEVRTVLAAHRQRATHRDPEHWARMAVDMVTASMAAGVRRAADLGEVIALRGGAAAPPRTRLRLQPRDLAALALVAAASIVPSIVG